MTGAGGGGAAATATNWLMVPLWPELSVTVSCTVTLPPAVGNSVTVLALVALLKPVTTPPPLLKLQLYCVTVEPGEARLPAALTPTLAPAVGVAVVTSMRAKAPETAATA